MDGKRVFEYHLAKPLFTLLKVHGCHFIYFSFILQLQFKDTVEGGVGGGHNGRAKRSPAVVTAESHHLGVVLLDFKVLQCPVFAVE